MWGTDHSSRACADDNDMLLPSVVEQRVGGNFRHGMKRSGGEKDDEDERKKGRGSKGGRLSESHIDFQVVMCLQAAYHTIHAVSG